MELLSKHVIAVLFLTHCSPQLQWKNKTTRPTVSYCWQMSFIIRSHPSPTGEHTCFAGTATVNRSPHWHSSRRWLEASMKNLAATSGRRHWPDCWCYPDREPRSFDVEDATTLSWSSAAVSEWVVHNSADTQGRSQTGSTKNFQHWS